MAERETRIQLCGPLLVEVGGRRLEDRLPARQGRQLFAYLALHRRRPVAREELVEALWGDAAPQSPDAVLSSVLARLRRAVGRELITGRGQLVLTLPGDVWLDVEVAVGAAADAEALLDGGSPEDAIAAARQVLEILDRPLLPELEAGWLDAQRRELEAVRERALAAVARAGIGLGGRHLAAADAAARRLIELEPYRESGYALLMEAHARGGNAAEALRVFDDLRSTLRRELGVPPSSGVTRLAERLLHSDAAPAPPATGPIPLPGPVAEAAQDPFVGRVRELGAVHAEWERAVRSGLRVVAIAGDAGVGKTALAGHFAGEVHAGGATVLYGASEDGSVVPYQPFVEALRHYVEQRPRDLLARDLGPNLSRLAGFLPELEPAATDRGDDPEMRRHRLFEAVAAMLVHAATPTPLLLILEDLHWADRASLLLLRHVLRRMAAARMLVIATYRDVEVAADHPLRSIMGDLRRARRFDHLTLGGLTGHETEQLAATAGHELPAAILQRLHEQTGGNPFFLLETLRAIRDSPAGDPERSVAEVGVPAGVKELLGRRLADVGESAGLVLRTAALLGPETRVGAIESVLELDGEEIVAALEELWAARILVPHPEDPERVSFAHALLRETVLSELSPTRRVRLHAQVAEALEADRERSGARSGELAIHYGEAVPILGPAKAVEWTVRAAEAAVRAGAYEEAGSQYERALKLVERAEPPDDALRLELLLHLGGVRWQASTPGAREAFERAIALARQVGDARQLARAVLGAGGRSYAPAREEGLRELVEESLAALPDAPSPLRARLLARLGESLPDDGERAMRLTAEAIEMARAVGDAPILAGTLLSRHAALLRPAHLAERLEVAREAIAIADSRGPRELAALARHWLVFDLLGAAQVDEARRERDELSRLAEDLHQPLYRHSALAWAAVLEHLRGDLAFAEKHAEESLELALNAQAPDANAHFTAQLVPIRRDQGRLGELLPAIEQLAGAEAGAGPWTAARPLLRLQAGDRDGARAALEALPSSVLAGVGDVHWLPSAVRLAEATAALRSPEAARPLRDVLEPYADQVAQATFAECLGSVNRALGLLAGALGLWAEAEERFEAAVARHTAMAAPILRVTTECDWAAVAVARGRSADTARARELLSSARATAAELGALGLQRRVESVAHGCKVAAGELQ